MFPRCFAKSKDSHKLPDQSLPVVACYQELAGLSELLNMFSSLGTSRSGRQKKERCSYILAFIVRVPTKASDIDSLVTFGSLSIRPFRKKTRPRCKNTRQVIFWKKQIFITTSTSFTIMISTCFKKHLINYLLFARHLGWFFELLSFELDSLRPCLPPHMPDVLRISESASPAGSDWRMQRRGDG